MCWKRAKQANSFKLSQMGCENEGKVRTSNYCLDGELGLFLLQPPFCVVTFVKYVIQ